MGQRRQSRELTLQYLYACDIQKHFTAKTNAFFDWITSLRNSDSSHKHISEEALRFSDSLINGIISHLEDIDKTIKKYADNWALFRIAYTDRNILRVAIYEIIYLTDIPSVVSIDEAVDIAKKFSTPDSGKFVNGILDRIKKDIVT